MRRLRRTGTEPPSPFRCPECGGALWEEAGPSSGVRFACHVGHTFSSDGLLTLHSAEVERAIWAAIRSLEEQAALRRRMARRADERKMVAISTALEEQAHDSERRAEIIRSVLVRAAAAPQAAAVAAPPPARPRTIRKRQGSAARRGRRLAG
jgi:two-component system chemotaxis response regulator CheB